MRWMVWGRECSHCHRYPWRLVGTYRWRWLAVCAAWFWRENVSGAACHCDCDVCLPHYHVPCTGLARELPLARVWN